MGSDLGVGHNPRAVRFRDQSLACAPFTPLVPFTPFIPLTPLCWVDAAERVDDEEVEEEIELSEEDEFDRCALLRGMSIRETSSALMLVKPLVGPLEPRHRFGGGATAVICDMWARLCPALLFLERSCLTFASLPHEHLALLATRAHDTATTTADRAGMDLGLRS